MSDTPHTILTLPEPIRERLEAVIRRVRRIQWMKGSLATLALAVFCVLVIMGIHAAFRVEAVPVRLALSLAGLVVTLTGLWQWLLRPLSRRISLTNVARWLETQHPEIQERLSTAVELSGNKDADPESAQLLAEVVRDAVVDAGKVDPVAELSTRRARGPVVAASAAVLALLAAVAIWPSVVPRLLARVLAPTAEIGNAWSGRIRLLTTDKVIAAGDPLDIEVAVQGGEDRVELRMIRADGTEMTEQLAASTAVVVQPGETGYALHLPGVDSGFTGRVAAGKALSEGFTIRVVPRPEVSGMEMVYHYPDYTGRPPATVQTESGEIAALPGTRIEVRATLTRAVTEAQVKMSGEPPFESVATLGTTAEVSRAAWEFTMDAGRIGAWHMDLKDADGISGHTMDWPVQALVDLPPVVTLETPLDEEMELRPVENFPLTYSVREDAGLAHLRIRVRPAGRPDYFLDRPLPDKVEGEPDLWRGAAALDLATLDLKDVGEIRVSIVADDTLPEALTGPQTGVSREILIRIRKDARPLIEQTFAAQAEELRRMMDKAYKDLDDARWRMQDKPNQLRDNDQINPDTLQQIEESAKAAATAEEKLMEIAERMKQTAFARQSPDLENIAQKMAKPASEQAQDIPLTDSRDERVKLAESARDKLNAAMEQLRKQKDQLHEDEREAMDIARLADLAERQQDLADQAKVASPPAEAASPDQSADPSATAQADPAASPGQSQAQANPDQSASADSPPQAPPPTAEQQQKWLDEQRGIAARAKDLAQQNRNANPDAQRQQMQQRAAEAKALADRARDLAETQSALEKQIAAADSPSAQEALAREQKAVAAAADALQDDASQFHQQAQPQIDQSSESQEAAYLAQSGLEEGAEESAAASETLASAAAAPPDASGDAPETGTPDGEAQTPPEAGTPADSPAGTASNESGNPGEGAPAGETPSGESGQTASLPASDTPGDPSGQPAGTGENAAPEAPGQASAKAAAKALDYAADQLEKLSQGLSAQAGMVADHETSLNEGAEQAGTAAEQAASAQQQGQAPSMQQGAQSAQQAAQSLAQAAATAMQSMGMSQSATTPQTSGSPGQPKPGQGNKPGPKGDQPMAGKQGEGAVGELPAELAKLGLTMDDWMKIKSVIGGAGSADAERVPAEYRDLVKAYFGALAKRASPQDE